jgi:beta-N-acetylhexosaminidase
VEDGRITGKRLEQSLVRVARLKAHYLRPFKPVTVSDARLVVGCRSHKVFLDSWHTAYGRVPKPKSAQINESAAVLDSPVTHV